MLRRRGAEFFGIEIVRMPERLLRVRSLRKVRSGRQARRSLAGKKKQFRFAARSILKILSDRLRKAA